MDQQANNEKIFDILIDTLEKYNQRFVTASVTIASVLLVIIGWMLTEDKVESFFGDSLIATIIYLCFFMPFQILAYAAPIRRVFRINHLVYNELTSLNYMPKKYYEHHKLPNYYLPTALVLNIGNYLIIGILVADAHWKLL